ncbi:hypothetical protein [Ramlibacter sp. AN1133]|uniref:hypothetical protein n=1 Tax=Ramlibacter sp. AN1133 TaxID=3133429 RepID=UPI0030BC3757
MPEVLPGCSIKDNDPRKNGRTLLVERLQGRFVVATSATGTSTQIQRVRIFTDGKARRTGFSLVPSEAALVHLHVHTRHPQDYVLLNEADGTRWRGGADGRWTADRTGAALPLPRSDTKAAKALIDAVMEQRAWPVAPSACAAAGYEAAFRAASRGASPQTVAYQYKGPATGQQWWHADAAMYAWANQQSDYETRELGVIPRDQGGSHA